MPKKRELFEHEIQRQILDWLKLRGIFHWRNNSGAMAGSHKGKKWFMRFGAVGSPDIFVIKKGTVIGLEVKGLKGKISDRQAEFGSQMNKAGGMYFVVRCLEDATRILES